MDSSTYMLGADGGGYWPGLVVPAIILIVALIAVAAVLVTTRGGASGEHRDDE